ncbi:uncharacterized protein BDW70DRAFT_8076 [Aspergillus foveolatus]|uniref:uncharacterized protein n=1 Tax=Aspergillus foveolatus TaxID=210207 RepID=UPI003CCC8F97
MADHLFFPDAPPKPLRIKYDGPLYDGSDWDTFPIHCGWLNESGAEDFLARYIPYVKIPEELNYLFQYRSMMECWLYFGMLHYVFGDQLDQSDFVLCEEKEGQQQYITTRHLHKYVENADDWKKSNRGARTVEIVHKVLDALPGYIRFIGEEMCLAIRLASLTLWNIAVKRDGPQPNPSLLGAWSLTSKELEKMRLFDGWCPLDAEKCCEAGIYLDTQAYLLQLRRTKPSWNNRTHESCKKTQCVADNIDESKYVTRHVQEDCTCSHIHADNEQLRTVLLDGGIPLAMITPCGEDELGSQQYELKIVRKRANKSYVAISHVWADGLGNPQGNSLPHCQLEFLYKQARRLLRDKEYIPGYDEKVYGSLHTGAARFAHFAANAARRGDNSVLVWIDTLCIPHQSDARNLAIQRIRDVYTSASRNLILDSELMLVDSRLCNKMEVCLRVLYCSGWIRRLWTLQEGLAAKDKLFVLLSDKAINIGTIPYMLFNKVDQGELPIFQEGIATMAAVTWYSYFQEPTDYASKFHRFVVNNGDTTGQGKLIAWNWFNVATRASSKDRDRPTVLAGLLNLDVGKILKVKEADERMRKLYSMLDMFPQDVIFLEGPRFEEYGLGWAIKTCRFTSEFTPLASDSGNITPRGLHVTLYPSLIALSSDLFDLALAKSKQSVPDQRQMDWEQWLDDSKPHCAPELDLDADYDPDYDSDPSSPATEPDDTKLSFLHLKGTIQVNLSQGEAYGIILRSALPDQIYTQCAVVALQTSEHGVHYGRYLSTGSISAVTFDRNVHSVDLPEDGYLLAGTWGDAQKYQWIVG